MAPKLKHDYAALVDEFDQRHGAGESIKDIKALFESRGISWGTFDNQRRAILRKRDSTSATTQERTMPDDAVEVLPGQLSIEDADTPAAVHHGAVNEFDALPAGYAKEIQPMRKYTDAEEWALNESLRLYGFFGTILRDQYGRTLDGHHRERLARLRGLGVPFVIKHVTDDSEAMAIARAANAVRRHLYTQEQRQELANGLRDQGFSYRAIADALGVGKSTVYRDIFGELRERDDSEDQSPDVPAGQVDTVSDPADVPAGQVNRDDHTEGVPMGHVSDVLDHPSVASETPAPQKRIRGRDQKSYPAKRPNGTTPATSPADRQLAQVINLLMSHAQQWSDQHWQAFFEVVQNLRGSKAPAPATE